MTGIEYSKSALSPESFLQQLGQVLCTMRKVAGISQVELGKVLSMHQTAISRIESGQQSMTPFEMHLISLFFGVRIDSILNGNPNYWKIAAKFNKSLKLPKKCAQSPLFKIREILPAFDYLNSTKEPSVIQDLLARQGLSTPILSDPDQSIGTACVLDFYRDLLSSGMIGKEVLKPLASHSRRESTQGFLHSLYEKQATPLSLIKTRVLNSHHYDENFRYELEESTNKTLALSVSTNPSLKEFDYKSGDLGAFWCEYRKAYFSEFPRYIQENAVEVRELQCEHKGARNCVFEIKHAS